MTNYSPRNRQRITARARRALELRIQGKLLREVADIIQVEFNQPRYTLHAASLDCRAALNDVIDNDSETIHTYRSLEIIKYDDYLNRIYSQIADGELAAIKVALDISAARARLLGLYAPVELKITQLVESRVSEELDRFMEAMLDSEQVPDYVKVYLLDIATGIKDKLEEAVAIASMN